MPLSALSAAIEARLPSNERAGFRASVESSRQGAEDLKTVARTLREVANTQRSDAEVIAMLDAMAQGNPDMEAAFVVHARQQSRGLVWRLSNVCRSDPARPVFRRRLRRAVDALPANAVRSAADTLIEETGRRESPGGATRG